MGAGPTRAPAVELDRAAVAVSSLPLSNTCNLHTEEEQEDESGDGVSFPNYPHTDVAQEKDDLAVRSTCF
jgi:hypothetical protein